MVIGLVTHCHKNHICDLKLSKLYFNVKSVTDKFNKYQQE